MVLSTVSYKETNVHRHLLHLKPITIKTNLFAIIKGTNSLKYASLLFVSFGFMTAWLTSGSVILQDKLHLTYMEFGYCALFVGLFYFIASFLSTKYIKQRGEESLISLGAKLLILPPLILSSSLLVENTHVLVITIVLVVAVGFLGTGFIIPNAYSLGVKSFFKTTGMAGAFFGFSQMFGGSVYSFFI